MSERPKLPLDIQAAIEDTREAVLKKHLADLSLLFTSDSILPISPIHMATPKPAKLKLQIRQFASTLFDIEASRYPQHATSTQQLKDWLNALAVIVEGEVAKELTPFALLHDFHCSAQERSDTITEVLRERIDFWLLTGEHMFVLNVTRGKIEPKFSASNKSLMVTSAIQSSDPLVLKRKINRKRTARFPDRAAWLRQRLTERGWDHNRLPQHGGPDRKTVLKILDGGEVNPDVLEKLAKSLSFSTKAPKVTILDIPRT